MKTCRSCGRTSNKSEFFCDACGEPLFEATGLRTGGSMSEYPAAPPAPGQAYPTPGYPLQGFPPQGYQPTTAYGASTPRRRKKRIFKGIVLAVFVCIVLAFGAIGFYIINQPKIKVAPPPGWTRAVQEVKKNFEEGLGGHLTELFVPQSGVVAFIAIARVGSGSLKNMPDTQDLETMREYLTSNRDMIARDYEEEGLVLKEAEARQLACGQSFIFASLESEDNGVSQLQDVFLIKKGSTIFAVSLINTTSSNLIEIEYLVQNITFE